MSTHIVQIANPVHTQLYISVGVANHDAVTPKIYFELTIRFFFLTPIKLVHKLRTWRVLRTATLAVVVDVI